MPECKTVAGRFVPFVAGLHQQSFVVTIVVCRLAWQDLRADGSARVDQVTGAESLVIWCDIFITDNIWRHSVYVKGKSVILSCSEPSPDSPLFASCHQALSPRQTSNRGPFGGGGTLDISRSRVTPIRQVLLCRYLHAFTSLSAAKRSKDQCARPPSSPEDPETAGTTT